jgi:hypothetical protein
MNDQGYDFNEAFFVRWRTNRNYAGPLDMPWLREGMCLAQWRNGIVSAPLEGVQVIDKFFRAGTLGLNVYPDLLCIWRIKAIKTTGI